MRLVLEICIFYILVMVRFEMIYVFASKFLLQKGLENLNFQKFQTQNHSYSTIDSKVVYLILGNTACSVDFK